MPEFYQEVFCSYNASKTLIPFNRLNPLHILNQPIWGNQYFMCNDKCLYFKEWIDSNVLLVRDVINRDGTVKSDLDLHNIITDRRDINRQAFILKKYKDDIEKLYA